MKAARSWLRCHPVVADGIVAVVVFALGILSDRIYYDIGAANPHNFRFAVGVAFVALLCLPLVFRRRLPPVTLVCVTLSVLGYTIFGITEASITATVAFVAIYSVGAYCGRPLASWVRGVCIAVMFGDLVWVLLFRQIDLGHSKASIVGAGILSVGSNVFFFVAAWVIGDVAWASRLRAAELAVRNAELNAAHEVIAEQAVLDERVRIAREVHDVVAHHVSVMGVQAGAARRVMARSPDQAAEVLSGIEASSRQAVVELQRLLGFLRSEAAPSEAAAGTTVAAPQPSLSDVDAVITQLNEAGLAVTLRWEGAPGPLPASVDLSAYRIVQEALTNALKHGGAGTIATVTITYAPDALRLEVVDDGRGRSNGRTDHHQGDPIPTAGHGLIGMRERVALHGGQFTAERARGSGFTVTATFPLSPAYRNAS
ncbi:MAG: histidine kinase dimerization and phosphoacceptor region [Acidimicrobiales bacterium]|nr:histidine kinase dimerization and phosphoacceptor region [Acidimicrobiales bacterium]